MYKEDGEVDFSWSNSKVYIGSDLLGKNNLRREFPNRKHGKINNVCFINVAKVGGGKYIVQ